MIWFSIKEMVWSATAKTHKIDNSPSEEIQANLTLFIETVLDPIRRDWGEAITVTSGYRCPELNRLVGGAKESGHQYGFCADLQVKGGAVRLRKFAEFVYQWMIGNNMKWDEIIFESAGGVTWLHFCWIGKDGRQRMKKFDIIN